MSKIGLQLYSIKEETAKDFFGSIEKVARMGYNGVQFAGYFNTPAKELKKVLDDNGILSAGSHVGLQLFRNDVNAVMEYSKTIGDAFVIVPALPKEDRENGDSYKRLAEEFTRYGEKCKEYGLQFAYHNHAFEFELFDGKYAYDILFENSDPDLVKIELDTFWVEYAGLKSVDYINKYKERCCSIHIKDMKSWEDKKNIEVGTGVMNFKDIAETAKKYGAEWFTVEQEYFEMPLFESVQISCNNLKKILG